MVRGGEHLSVCISYIYIYIYLSIYPSIYLSVCVYMHTISKHYMQYIYIYIMFSNDKPTYHWGVDGDVPSAPPASHSSPSTRSRLGIQRHADHGPGHASWRSQGMPSDAVMGPCGAFPHLMGVALKIACCRREHPNLKWRI